MQSMGIESYRQGAEVIVVSRETFGPVDAFHVERSNCLVALLAIDGRIVSRETAVLPIYQLDNERT
jgi:hypothetical protein